MNKIMKTTKDTTFTVEKLKDLKKWMDKQRILYKEGYLHKKFDEFIDILEDHKKATQDLHKDLKNGAITANVFLDSQKLDSAVGRRLAYTGTLV